MRYETFMQFWLTANRIRAERGLGELRYRQARQLYAAFETWNTAP